MKTDNYFANGRVAVLSTRLLTEDKLLRIAECNELSEALKALYETGYADGTTLDNASEYQKLLDIELNKVCGEVRTLSSDQRTTEYFLVSYDYTNAKILMKSKYARTDGVEQCFACGKIAPQTLQQLINNDDYDSLPKPMADALMYIDQQYANGNRSPVVVDMALDKAMYADMCIRANKSSWKALKEYFKTEVDCLNLLTFFRAKRAGYDVNSYEQLIVDGGDISKQSLVEAYNTGYDKLRDILYYSNFRPLVDTLIHCWEQGNFAPAESAIYSSKRKIIDEQADSLTVQPLVKYYLDKVREADALRYVLIAVKSKLDKSTVKERLKELYE